MRQAPASFDDHFSQPRLFWLSMNPAEREHIVAALHLRARQVVQGLGLPAPEPSEPLADVQLSPTLSQVGHIDGQRIPQVERQIIPHRLDVSGRRRKMRRDNA